MILQTQSSKKYTGITEEIGKTATIKIQLIIKNQLSMEKKKKRNKITS